MATKANELMPAIDDGLRNILTQKTPDDAIKQRKGKGGKTFSFVEHSWVTAQLNTAFNWGWSWEIVQWQVIPTLEEAVEVFVLGKLTVHTPNGDITKMQFGTQAIKRDRHDNILSIGDDLKGASSDGLKKAASLLGLALDLYKSDAPPDDDGTNLASDPMTGFWAAAKAKGMTQAEGAALLAKCKGNPDRALKELAGTNGNDKEEIEQAKTAFFAGVIDKIPYYESNTEIGKVLKQAGFTTYKQADETKMLAALEKHANEAANKEAA